MCSIKELIQMSDAEFYEKHLAELPLEEQAAFFKEFPDFLKEEPLEHEVRKDEMYRKISSFIK